MLTCPSKARTRFWSHVDVRSDDECWEWRLSRTKHGYGHFRIDGRMEKAHRVALAIKLGGLSKQALHTCDNPPCCNPNHLFEGDQAENVADMVKKSRARGAPREQNAKAKLTTLQVVEIRRRLALGVPHRKLAAEYGVSKGAISFIASNKTWVGV